MYKRIELEIAGLDWLSLFVVLQLVYIDQSVSIYMYQSTVVISSSRLNCFQIAV